MVFVFEKVLSEDFRELITNNFLGKPLLIALLFETLLSHKILLNITEHISNGILPSEKWQAQ